MASSSKKKTTFAKLAREQKLRERRLDKAAKKDARRRETEIGPAPSSESEPGAAAGDVQHAPLGAGAADGE